MFCREQAARFTARLAEIESLGAKVVAIGNGTAAMAQDFVDNFDVRFDVYTDPSRRSYDAAGLVRGLGINTKSVKSAWRALKGGHVQGRTKGDPWQQGGVLVLGNSGDVLFAHADAAAGDHAELDAVVAALRSAA